MDGIHDMGGMHGFGPIATVEPETMGFHEAWHGRVFAMSRAVRWTLAFTGDSARARMEQLPPAEYLRTSYYAKWLHGNLEPMKALGAVSEDEIASGVPQPLLPGIVRRPMLSPEEANRLIFAGMPDAARDPQLGPARYREGARVWTIAHLPDPKAHTRLPRYARDRVGVIEAVVGTFMLADSIAAGSPRQEWVYRVVFAAFELWGEAPDSDEVVLDLWESYIVGEVP